MNAILHLYMAQPHLRLRVTVYMSNTPHITPHTTNTDRAPSHHATNAHTSDKTSALAGFLLNKQKVVKVWSGDMMYGCGIIDVLVLAMQLDCERMRVVVKG